MASVICVDNSPITRGMYESLFTEHGYDVRVFSNGMDALQDFRRHPADVFVIDSGKGHMSGCELCAHIRRQPESFDLPVVMVSGHASETEIAFGLSAGATDYILKPVRAAELIAKVKHILQRKQRWRDQGLELEPNSLFAGRYGIIRKIGLGGHSAVYAARDTRSPRSSRLVVVKIFDLAFYRAETDKYITLLLREAFEHSKLDHPNIVKFIDFGQAGGCYFIVMEYLYGLSIDEMVREHGPLTEENLLFVGHQISKAVVYLESRDLLHRDVKPSNVVVTRDGTVKLLDFGLSRKRTDVTLSLNDEFMGSPHTVSPEYIRGDDGMDSRTDVYSLGVTLYFAAAGCFPFDGNSAMDILQGHLHATAAPLHEGPRPDLPLKLSRTIGQMLAREPADRPGPQAALNAFRRMLHRRGDTTRVDATPLAVDD